MEIGEVLRDRYKAVRFLGRGETGPVYLCDDLNLPGRRWSVKEMQASDSVGEEEFEREVQIVLGLRHRNLPTVVDHFREGDRQFLVFEHVEGENLLSRIKKEGPANEFEALRWGLEIARVLAYLHGLDRPVIYRDLNPARVMVTAGRHIKLVDFGLARYHEPDRVTEPRGMAGYAPPEQRDEPARTDQRSDIYALGATLYYALTGRDPSPVPEQNDLAAARPDLSRGTLAMMARCMATDPEKRYRKVSDLMIAVEQLLAGARAARRLPPVFAAVAFVVLLLALVAAGAWWLPRAPAVATPTPSATPSPGAEQRDQAELLLARNQPEEALAILDDLVTRHPEDAVAHILRQNAYARLTRGPVTRLPVMVSLSGSDSGGYKLLYGYAMAQERLNRQGGRPIVLDLFDDRSQVDLAIRAAQEIVATSDYRACLGPFSSQHVLAVAPLFNNAAVPLLAPTASDPRVHDSGPFIFSAGEPDRRRVDRLAEHFLKAGLVRAAVVFNEEDVSGKTAAEAFVSRFTAGGGEVVAQRRYGDEEGDFVGTVSGLNGAQVVFVADYRASAVAGIAAALPSPLPLGLLTVPQEPGLSLSFLEGAVLASYFKPDEEFRESFRRSFGLELPSIREACAYDSLSLLAGVLPAPDLAGALRDVVYDGVSGEFSVSRSLDLRPVYLFTIREGSYHQIGGG